MATITGSFANNSKNVQPWMEYTFTQSVANNTTTITAKLYVKRLTSYGQSWSSNSKYSITLGGTTVVNKTGVNINISNLSVGSSMLLDTVSRTISNNSDGSLKATVAGMVEITGSSLGVGNVSQSVTFPTIPRATTPTIGGTKTFGSSIIINHSGASTAFKHTIKYTLGSATGTIGTDKTGTSTAWTIPKDLQSQIPNATTATMKITLITKNGSTEIGSKDVSFTVALAGDCVPSISSAAFADAMTKPSTVSGYYQNYSKVKATVSAAGTYGSKITTYKLKVGSMGEVSSSSNVLTSGTLTASGAQNIVLTVVDSRGKTATKTYTSGITATAYTPPSISTFSYKRTIIENGVESPSNMGTIGYVTHAGTIQSSMPTKTRQLKYKPTTTSTWTTVNLSNANQTDYKFTTALSGSTAYNLQLVYKDDLTTVVRDLVMTNVFPLISLNAKGNGLAFGKDAVTENLIDVVMPIKINGGTPYTTTNKPSASTIGALSTSGGTVTGLTTFNRGSATQAVAIHTQGDSNGNGDGQTHLGYYSNGAYNHYFRGKGTTYIDTHAGLQVSKNLNIGGSSTFAASLTVGNYEETWRGITVRRKIGTQNYAGRYAVSYSSNVKLTSSTTAFTAYGASIECYNGTDAVRRVLVAQNCMIPTADNNTYLGTSTHRWQSVYATSGTVYSSSAKEKNNIVPLNINLYNRSGLNTKDIIVNGIKDTNLYAYNYKALNNDDTFVGFLGQELEQNSPEFFNLIGSSYTTDDGREQYDIRESSVLGVLWAGLQEALVQIDTLKQENAQIKEKLSQLLA